jgi:hypothetical protein
MVSGLMMMGCEETKVQDASNILGYSGSVVHTPKDTAHCAKPPQDTGVVIHHPRDNDTDYQEPVIDPVDTGVVGGSDPFGGTCKDPSPRDLGIAIKCTNVSDPVCGCDNVTYTNACQAAGVGGVNVLHKGACASIK